jgi:tetratricopeptide (TPR) repeat protein
MSPRTAPIRIRVLCRFALAAGSIAYLTAGCGAGDPLEAIREQHAKGDFEGSVEPLRDLLADRSDAAEVNYLYARALVLTGKPTLSIWALRNAMEDPDWLIPAGLQLAQLRLQVREFGDVSKIASRILEQEPENLPALMLRAQANAHGKLDLELALSDVDRLLALEPDELSAYEPRIAALLALERRQEAREALAEAGRRLKDGGAAPGVIAWHCLATAKLELESGEPDAARETWGKCVEAHPTDLQVVSGAMEFHDAHGELDLSLEIVRNALEQAPHSRPLRMALADRLVIMHRPAEAEAVLREATSSPIDEEAATAWLDLGKLRSRLGDYGAAAEAIEQALELARQSGPPPPQVEFEYADTLAVAGQLQLALEVAEELSVPAHRHLIRARVAQQRRQPAAALAEFGEGNRLWPDNAYARYYTALAAEELGDFERALEEYRYSVRNDPGATDARIRGATLLLDEGKPHEALAMLQSGTGRGAPLEIEGVLLSMRVYGFMGNLIRANETLERLEKTWPARVGSALAAAAEGATARAGPDQAVAVLASAPKANYQDRRYAPALRAFVRFAHEAGDTTEAQTALERALVAHPDFGAFQEIRGLDLELSGAPRETVRAAYLRALELQPANARALEGLGRLALDDDPVEATAFFDRAAATDPSDPTPRREAARALAASDRPDEAAERLDALLLSHPSEAEAAAMRARLDLERGIATERTLERARRAVRFGGGAEALDLLGAVHGQRGEADQAARAAERARVLREKSAAQG